VPQSDFDITPPPETGSTFLDNALIKARHAAAIAGLPSIADDSGLAVDALDGAPGVFSARFAGPRATDDDNVDRLLHDLLAVAPGDRGAGFHCVAVFVRDAADPAPLTSCGEWRGSILAGRHGTQGFGYDPVFLDAASGKSAAEMTADEKNRVSHRGRAVRELARLLGAAVQ
jgi:XTP/dITP diphosphohydrolase